MGHVTKIDDDWGLGQIDSETIKKMVPVTERMGITLTFARKVTALDDITGRVKTITAAEGYLFVFHRGSRDLTDFWKEVDCENGGK